jgi:hypothetical protein
MIPPKTAPKLTGGQFNPYAAGRKAYGGGRDFPTIGANNKLGYRMRDAQGKARKRAVMRRMKALQSGRIMQQDVLRGMK